MTNVSKWQEWNLARCSYEFTSKQFTISKHLSKRMKGFLNFNSGTIGFVFLTTLKPITWALWENSLKKRAWIWLLLKLVGTRIYQSNSMYLHGVWQDIGCQPVSISTYAALMWIQLDASYAMRQSKHLNTNCLWNAPSPPLCGQW